MNKRSVINILIILFVAILAVNSVSAWWDTFECEGFSIEIPEGLEKATGYSPTTPPKYVPFVEDRDNPKWNFMIIELSEVPLDELPDNIDIAENHTESNLTIVKGQLSESVDELYYDGGDNITYAEFDKDGKHFYLEITHSALDSINLNEDMKLVNEIKESIKVK